VITIAPGRRVFQPRARRGKARCRLATGRACCGGACRRLARGSSDFGQVTNARMMHQWDAGTSFWSNSIFCERCRSDCMRSHAIACDRMQSHEIANLMSTTVRVLENASGTRSGTESLPKCFFTTTVNRFHLLFFSPFSKRKK
jgi:hypothetical protein